MANGHSEKEMYTILNRIELELKELSTKFDQKVKDTDELSTEIKALKDDITDITKNQIEFRVYVKLITWVGGVLMTASLGYIVVDILKLIGA